MTLCRVCTVRPLGHHEMSRGWLACKWCRKAIRTQKAFLRRMKKRAKKARVYFQ